MRAPEDLITRLKSVAPEAIAFGVIGVGNVLLYLIIFNVTLIIGAVKATVIATVLTTTLSYFANRHWTYKARPKSARRREYALFFAFNLAGMVIQSSVVGVAKYGLGLSEAHNRLALNVATCLGVGLATVFRFWAYRTIVFRPHPRAADIAAAIPGTPLLATPEGAEIVFQTHRLRTDEHVADPELDTGLGLNANGTPNARSDPRKPDSIVVD